MAIVITGAAGFIGSCLTSYLNKKGIIDLILVDDFTNETKNINLIDKQFTAKIDRELFLFDMHRFDIDFIFHIGARTDTTEFNTSIFDKLNINYSKKIWSYCSQNNVPLIYASSAATYGAGEFGFSDENQINSLTPLNPYGDSKQIFDLWAQEQTEKPPFWVGLKFFNVFGPNEYHKGRMASVVLHAYHQISEKGRLNLFQSHHPNYKNGEQIRDFIYVKDLLELLWFWYTDQTHSGLYNAGTGAARTFNDLAKAIFLALDKEPQIDYVPTPADIRDKYQYFTEATMQKTRNAGYNIPFSSLENAVADYVQNYLTNHIIY